MQSDRKQQLDEQWLDSLLTSAYQADEKSQARIDAVMQRLSEPATTQPARAPWYSLRNLSALAIAASLLVLAVFVIDSSDQRAYATVARSARATPKARHYRMQMAVQRPIGVRELSADLYIDPTNRFVLKLPGMLGFGTAWIGGDANERWIAPPRGPVIIGGEEVVGRWLIGQDIVSPYLHMSTLMERMGNGYALTMLSDVALKGTDDREVTCTHIRGDVRQARPWLPRTIELWADKDTGVAQKVILHWTPIPNRRGPVRWTIDLADTPGDLAENWFDIDGHAPGRPIVRARSDRDLEQHVSEDTSSN